MRTIFVRGSILIWQFPDVKYIMKVFSQGFKDYVHIDFKTLDRSVEYLKCFASYNMVVIHGYVMISTVMTVHHHESPFQGFSIFRGFFSLLLPWFAGYYLRSYLGPKFSENRLRSSVARSAWPIFYAAVLLEIVRLFFIFNKFTYSFNWNPLHFIGLSMMLTLWSLTLSRRSVLYLFFITIGVSLITSGQIPFAFPVPAGSESVLSGIWAVLFGLSVSGLMWWILSSRYSARVRLSVMGAGGALVAFLVYPEIRADLPNLTAFYNLPKDLFFPGRSQNLWPFVRFYPIFAAGYLTREGLARENTKGFVKLALLGSSALAFWFLSTRISDYNKRIGAEHIFSNDLFSMQIGMVLGLIALFNLSLFLLYTILKNRTTPLLDRWSFYSRNVLILYVIHMFVFSIFRFFLPAGTFSDVWQFHVLFLFFVVHTGYAVSLLGSHFFLKSSRNLLLNRWPA